tara:strand:- start:6392 stop:6640 length:249 start_codon:yes stop_codon:yes gene_type:complete
MSTLITMLINSKLARYAGAVLLIVGAFLGLRAKWRGDGRADAKRKQREAAAERGEQRRQVDAKVDDLGSDELRDGLRRWARD